ncbi:alpha N-terminal protein methyltransferase 1 [Tanacetum coccineum]
MTGRNLIDEFEEYGRGRDCGSGLGRVTKNLLIKYFNEAARENLSVSEDYKAANFYCTPLQALINITEFTPGAGRYDVIWIQWCIGHLADADFVSFFKRAKAGPKPGGLFVLKEYLVRSGNGAVVSKYWRKDVTHVIAATDLTGACTRTLKVLMAILNGKWKQNVRFLILSLAPHVPCDIPFINFIMLIAKGTNVGRDNKKIARGQCTTKITIRKRDESLREVD